MRLAEHDDGIYYTDGKQRKRKYHVQICSECGAHVWTSSVKRDFMCMSCRRSSGLTANNRYGSYTTLAAPPKIDTTFGQCPVCRRGSKRNPLRLENGRCQECHWYGMGDIDPDLSDNGRKGRGGRGGY